MLPQLLERAGTGDRPARSPACTRCWSTATTTTSRSPTPPARSSTGTSCSTRKLATAGHFPAIDVLESISRVATAVVPPPQMTDARELRRMMAALRDVRELIEIGAYQAGSDPLVDRARRAGAARSTPSCGRPSTTSPPPARRWPGCTRSPPARERRAVKQPAFRLAAGAASCGATRSAPPPCAAARGRREAAAARRTGRARRGRADRRRLPAHVRRRGVHRRDGRIGHRGCRCVCCTGTRRRPGRAGRAGACAVDRRRAAHQGPRAARASGTRPRCSAPADAAEERLVDDLVTRQHGTTAGTSREETTWTD